MTDELVAYLLDDLCPERRADVERRLETDAAWQRELERLKECLAATGDPAKCVEEPPRDLVTRTCCYVEREQRRSCHSPATASCGPSSGLAAASWSFADVSVGGGVVLLLGMLMLPAMRESRDAARRMTCQNNLKTLGTGLFEFQQNHGGWLPPVRPGESSSQYIVALADHVGMNRGELIRLIVCPDSKLADQIAAGEIILQIPSYRQLAAMTTAEQRGLLQGMAGSYASRVGFRDRRGDYHYVKYTAEETEPLLSDAPSLMPSGVRSANHDGCGQNVLDESLSVRYLVNSDLATSLDNIFLNAEGRHDAGCNRDDRVLLRGDYGPGGPVMVIKRVK